MSDNGKSKCHWLPCSIDYDGLAPVHVHFRPEQIPAHDNDDANDVPTHNDNPPSSSSSSSSPPVSTTAKAKVHAASFRGHGLLAQNPISLPQHIIGSVIMSDDQSTNDPTALVAKEVFDEVLEWEHDFHEHNLVRYEKGKMIHDTQSQSSIGKSLAILDILHSVHEPIPILNN